MEELAKEVADDNFKPKMGIKEVPWWTFIPLNNFLPPLLHMLLGIWNAIWDKFREIVSKDIEYITTEEADL